LTKFVTFVPKIGRPRRHRPGHFYRNTIFDVECAGNSAGFVPAAPWQSFCFGETSWRPTQGNSRTGFRGHVPTVSDSFRDFVLDQLAGLRQLDARAMFGGYGLYNGTLFFGLLWGEKLFFRTDETTRQPYLESEMEPFSPGGKVALKNYYEVPVDILEDNGRLMEWAQTAIRVSAAVPPKPKRKSGRRPLPARKPVKRSKPPAGKKRK